MDPTGSMLRSHRAFFAVLIRLAIPFRSAMANLVLASASPRRRELLTQAGYSFTVRPAHIPEDPLPAEDPITYVPRLAREKAEVVFCQLADPAAIVLGA